MRGRLIQYLAAACLTAGVFGPARLAAACSFTIIHSFTGPTINNDGEAPEDAPAVAASGAIFGATAGGGQYQQGAIYMFTPPAKKGGLYCLTNNGGANSRGTAFRLTPASGGAYTATDLYDFTPAANKVFGTLTAGKGGVYYGVTYNATGAYGTVFSLKP